MPYYYYKAQTVGPNPFSVFKNKLKNKMVKILPNTMIVIGATAVLIVSFPMFSYKLDKQKWQQNKPVSPVGNQLVQDPASPVIAYQEQEPEIISGIDFTKAENWFVGGQKDFSTSQNEYVQVNDYSISIPKLNIDAMNVKIGGDNLDQSLIQYPGTSTPGQYGNPVIFGHSVLPVFYNPKSYMAVFSKLPTLKKDDEIYINYDGIKYRYVVESYHEVEPDQVEVLEQRFDRQTLTLITCVPPGTYLRRGVIQAVLEKL